MRRTLPALCALGWALSAWARPTVPSSDAVILERVPAAASAQVLKPLREKLLKDPNDLQSALALSKGYLEIGRQTADPRFTSYAQATLAPWLEQPAPPPDVQVMSATALQNLHQFDRALTLLNRAVVAQPENAQAWLTMATVLQVQGRFDEARAACVHLSRVAEQLVALTCLASVNSLTGRLASSYAALQVVYRDDARLPASLRTWVMGQMAEMAVRRGDDLAAEKHLQAALRVAPADLSLKSDYADLLLRQNRTAEAVALLRNNEQQDNLLLRLAIAGKRGHNANARRWADLFEARYQAARRDQDFTHLREQARFDLEVRGKPADALRLAQQNWKVQKEPADIRIYLAAAEAERDDSARREVMDWIRSVHYEDRTVR